MSWSAPSTCFLSTSRDGDSTTSLGSLVQCLTTLSVKKFFLISNPNLPWRNLRPLPLILWLVTWQKRPTPTRYVSSWQIWHRGYTGPVWSNGWRAEGWLPRVPGAALSSSAVAGEGTLGSWCSLSGAGCPCPGCQPAFVVPARSARACWRC